MLTESGQNDKLSDEVHQPHDQCINQVCPENIHDHQHRDDLVVLLSADLRYGAQSSAPVAGCGKL